MKRGYVVVAAGALVALGGLVVLFGPWPLVGFGVALVAVGVFADLD